MAQKPETEGCSGDSSLSGGQDGSWDVMLKGDAI